MAERATLGWDATALVGGHYNQTHVAVRRPGEKTIQQLTLQTAEFAGGNNFKIFVLVIRESELARNDAALALTINFKCGSSHFKEEKHFGGHFHKKKKFYFSKTYPLVVKLCFS